MNNLQVIVKAIKATEHPKQSVKFSLYIKVTKTDGLHVRLG